jgi:CRP-like cAMP-binding protein
VPVQYSLGEVLWHPGDPISRVYFPTSGILSAVVVMQDGGTVEAWLTGSEGAAGLEAAFGIPRATWRMTVQADGAAMTIAPADLASFVETVPAFQQLLFRYSHSLQQLSTQSLACHRFHPVQERLARWLLMTMDRQEGRSHAK